MTGGNTHFIVSPNLIYELLSRIQLCLDFALFGGHFWPKFGDGEHKNLIYEPVTGDSYFPHRNDSKYRLSSHFYDHTWQRFHIHWWELHWR